MVELIRTGATEDTTGIELKFKITSVNCNRDRLLGNCSLYSILIIGRYCFITTYFHCMVPSFLFLTGAVFSFVRVVIFGCDSTNLFDVLKCYLHVSAFTALGITANVTFHELLF